MVTNNKLIPHDLNYSSPIFPAHTQLDLVFKKNKVTNFVDFMIPYKVDQFWGSNRRNLTNEERETALTYELEVGERDEEGNETVNQVDRVVDKVEIKVKDCYLQVSKYHRAHCLFSVLNMLLFRCVG